jgi:hypothetical protein
MSDTIRKGMVLYNHPMVGLIKFNRYSMKHDPSWYRRGLNNSFRAKEKQYFMKFGEYLKPVKNRGCWW